MREKKSVLGWVLTFAGEKKRDYLASAALAILGSVCQLLPYLVMARVLTRLLAGDRDLIAYLRDCGLLALLWLARLGLHSLSTARSHAATFAVLAGIRKRGLEKLARMPLGDIQARGTGELKNILVERVDSMEPTLAHAIPEISGNAAAALATLLCLFLLDWRMALAALLPLPLGLVFFALMMRGYQENYQRASAATKVLNDTAVEYIGGIEVIKVFGKAKSSYEKFVTAARDCAESYIDWMRKSNFYFTFAMNVMPATLLTVLPIGGLLLRSGTLAPDRFVLLLILSLGLVPPIIGCMKFTDDLAKVGTIIGQVTDILTAPELPRPETDRAMPRDHSVELRNVRFGYGETEVLHGIDLTFREGTVNALVGPSGSGKSTLIKLLTGEVVPSSGRIMVNGFAVSSITPRILPLMRRTLGIIFQDFRLIPKKTVYDNLDFVMRAVGAPNKEIRQRIPYVLDLVGLKKKADYYPTELSGGEQQRVAIARALAKNPKLLLCDEPTGALDSSSATELLTALTEVNHTLGTTILMVTHDPYAASYTDRILYFKDGHIISELQRHDAERRRFYEAIMQESARQDEKR